MAELTGLTAAAVNTVAPTAGIVVLGIATGLDYVCLLAGLFGGAVALSHSPPMPAWRRLASIPSASLTAGYLAPWLTDFAVSYLSTDPTQIHKLLPFVAFAIGFSAHTILLPALHKIGNKWVTERTSS